MTSDVCITITDVSSEGRHSGTARGEFKGVVCCVDEDLKPRIVARVIAVETSLADSSAYKVPITGLHEWPSTDIE
jgi:hypothetical protein